MNGYSKGFAIILIGLIAIAGLSLLIVKPANAQTVPKPTVPEFAAEFIPNYVNVTTTDPYTGANTTTTQNLSTIKLTIINQQYSYSNGSAFGIYYDVRVKGHFDASSWNELYPTTQLLPSTVNVTQLNANNYQNYEVPYIWGQNRVYSYQFLPQSNATTTTVSLSASDYSPNSQVDIQVKAMLGVNSTFYLPSNDYAYGVGGSYYPAIAYETSSDWSNTQTVSISQTNASPNPSQTSTLPTPTITLSPSPTVPELSLFVVLSMLLPLALVFAAFRHRRHVIFD